jgi:glycine dehydrogenase subunit 2
MPLPTVEKRGEKFIFDFGSSQSVGKLSAFWGNYLVLLRAYAYVLSIGNAAHEISETAVANAYYLKEKLCPPFELAYENPFLHEFVISCEKIHRETGVRAFDIAKRLMDFGFHSPTMYFPLTVKEALMVEPTETESRETFDAFADAMKEIYRECYENPEIVKTAPHTTVVRRVNEVKAARDAKLREDL